VVIVAGIPHSEAIEETEPRAVEHILPTRIVAGTKVHCAAKDALETVRETTVRDTVVRQAEFFKNLRTGLKLDYPTPLAHGLSSSPDGDEPVLAERESVLGVTVDLEEEPAVAAPVDHRANWWPLQRHSTEHERTSAVDEVLSILGALLSDELDDLDLFQRLFGARDLQPAGLGKLAKRRADVFHSASSWLISGGRGQLDAPGLFLRHELGVRFFVTLDRRNLFNRTDVIVRVFEGSFLVSGGLPPETGNHNE
jgi:hypothetical protein